MMESSTHSSWSASDVIKSEEQSDTEWPKYPDQPIMNEKKSRGDDLEAAEGYTAHLKEEPTPPRQIHGIHWFLVVVGILSSIFLYSLDNTIMADIIPAIIDYFQCVDNIGWLSVGFFIGGVAVIMPLGKLYDLLNAKWLYVGSATLFLAASTLCGGAPTIEAEIVGRVLAGAGGTGLFIGVLTLLSVNTSETERPIYLSLVGLLSGFGTVLGPVIGGVFEKVTWRWAFYVNLIIGSIFAPVYIFLLPSFQPIPGKSAKDKFRDFDYVGALLSITALITIAMAINFGGTLFPWHNGSIVALFEVSGLLTIMLGAQQYYSFLTTTATRMFPIHFLKNKEAVLLFICAAACNAGAFIPIYYIPIYFQFTRGDDALQSALHLLPLIFLLSFTIVLNGFLMPKFGYYQPWYMAGAALSLIATALLSTINSKTSAAEIYGFEVLLGIGGGAFIQADYAVIQAVVDPVDFSDAIVFIMLAQIGGITLGLATASAIFINSAQTSLAAFLPPETPRGDIQQLISGTGSTFVDSLPAETRERALEIVIGSLGKAFVPACVAAGVALVGSLCLGRKRGFGEVGGRG